MAGHREQKSPPESSVNQIISKSIENFANAQKCEIVEQTEDSKQTHNVCLLFQGHRITFVLSNTPVVLNIIF
jgi:hypothetical protein